MKIKRIGARTNLANSGTYMQSVYRKDDHIVFVCRVEGRHVDEIFHIEIGHAELMKLLAQWHDIATKDFNERIFPH